MKESKDIDQIIANILSGTYTEQQEKELNEWISQSKENAFQFKQIKGFWKERTLEQKLLNHDTTKLKVWHEFLNNRTEKQSRRNRAKIGKHVWKFAAIILLLIIPTIVFIHHINNTEVNTNVQLSHQVIKQNPAGQKSQIQLSDGSKVWLNAESTLFFSENFSDSIREVKLVGEAFFEVNHDSTRPFIVRTEDLSVAVLGTQFNITAYSDDEDISVSLVRGSVKVNINNRHIEDTILLKPGLGVVYSKVTHDTNKYSLLEDEFLYNRKTDWINGSLVFNGQDFQSFVKEVSRWYGVNVTVQGEPPSDWRIRGAFENEYLTNILDAISFNKDFHYDLNGKDLKLMFN